MEHKARRGSARSTEETLPAALRRRALLSDLPPLQRDVHRLRRRLRRLDLPLVRLAAAPHRLPVRPRPTRSRAWPRACCARCATRWTACSSPTTRSTSWSTSYGVDGVVFHPIKSCRTVSTGLADSRRALMARRDIPSLLHRVRHDGPARRLGGAAQEPHRRVLRGPGESTARRRDRAAAPVRRSDRMATRRAWTSARRRPRR